MTIRAIRDDEARVEMLGYHVALREDGPARHHVPDGGVRRLPVCDRRLRLADPPGVFLSTQVLVWVGIGGRGTLVGPILGTILVSVLEVYLSGEYEDIWPLFVGFIFLAVVLFWPKGLYPLVQSLASRLPRCAPSRHDMSSSSADGAIVATGLRKHFGGVAALDDLSITVDEREIRCVVGPNGAGKSTLFKVLAGLERPDSGVVRILGRPTAGLHARDVARLGVATKLQTPRIFPSLTVREHLGLAARAGQGVRQLLGLGRRQETVQVDELVDELLDEPRDSPKRRTAPPPS